MMAVILIINVIARDTLESVVPLCLDFFCVVGRRLTAATGDVYEMFFMFQSLFIIIRHYNFVLIM